jgi:hypothetical protein
MARKPRPPPEVITSYENFLYLLAELELVVQSGAVRWTAAAAIMAARRLDKLAGKMHELAVQFDGD